MVQYNPLRYLPTAEELPDSDDTPVDNELQILIPNLLTLNGEKSRSIVRMSLDMRPWSL